MYPSLIISRPLGTMSFKDNLISLPHHCKRNVSKCCDGNDYRKGKTVSRIAIMLFYYANRKFNDLSISTKCTDDGFVFAKFSMTR